MPPDTMPTRIAAVRQRIAASCERANRDPASVTLVAVSKTHDAVAVIAAMQSGVLDFGENRVQEAIRKQAMVPPVARWHMVGHLQSNKAKAAAGRFAILHGIDSENLLLSLGRAALAPQAVMLEVNVSGERSKFGIASADLEHLVSFARSTPNILLEGLMTVAPQCDQPGDVRPVFRRLREMAAQQGLPSLSMGMTDDFEIAIEEGATHIRVGRAIFGERTTT